MLVACGRVCFSEYISQIVTPKIKLGDEIPHSKIL
jgi:hypothetical protein